MALPLPTLRGTSQQALYPFKRTLKCSTLVSLNQDGSQQRSILDNPRMLFDLSFTRLNQTDKNSQMAFVASAAGQAATNESLTLGNVTYTNLSLDSDLYSGQVRAAAMWDVSLKLTQTVPQALTTASTTLASNVLAADTIINVASVTGFNGYLKIDTEIMFVVWTPDSTHLTVTRGMLGTTAASHSSGATVSWGPGYVLGQAFPALPNGTRTQIPWQQNQQYKAEVSAMDAGPKYTFPWYGGHLNNFPTTGLLQWVVGGDMLTDAEVAQLEAHFLANWGRFAAFTFTDPETGTTYSNSYYTTDEFTVEYVAPNVNRVRLTIEAYEQGAGTASAVLSFVTSHIPGTGTTGTADVTLGSTRVVGGGAVMYDGSSWTLRTNTSSWTAGGSWSGPIGPLYAPVSPLNTLVNFFIFGSLAGSASPPEVFRIHDCYMDVTFADGTSGRYRPSSASAIPGAYGTIVNPQNAIDGNTSTYCEIDQSTFGTGFAFPQLILNAWAPSP